MSYSNKNALTLEDCYTNIFKLIDLCGLQWKKLTCDKVNYLDLSLDPIIRTCNECLNQRILAAWRRLPRDDSNEFSFQHKELWIFWFGDGDPLRGNHIPTTDLIEKDHGDWTTGIGYDCRTQLFKALFNIVERLLVSENFVRLDKWFISPLSTSIAKPSQCLVFNLCNFFLHGDSAVCTCIEVQRASAVWRLTPALLPKLRLPVPVALAPYGLHAELVGPSDQLSTDDFQRMKAWACLYPGSIDADDTPAGGQRTSTCRSFVDVLLAGRVPMRYPLHLVLLVHSDFPNGLPYKSSTCTSRNAVFHPSMCRMDVSGADSYQAFEDAPLEVRSSQVLPYGAEVIADGVQFSKHDVGESRLSVGQQKFPVVLSHGFLTQLGRLLCSDTVGPSPAIAANLGIANAGEAVCVDSHPLLSSNSWQFSSRIDLRLVLSNTPHIPISTCSCPTLLDIDTEKSDSHNKSASDVSFVKNEPYTVSGVANPVLVNHPPQFSGLLRRKTSAKVSTLKSVTDVMPPLSLRNGCNSWHHLIPFRRKRQPSTSSLAASGCLPALHMGNSGPLPETGGSYVYVAASSVSTAVPNFGARFNQLPYGSSGFRFDTDSVASRAADSKMGVTTTINGHASDLFVPTEPASSLMGFAGVSGMPAPAPPGLVGAVTLNDEQRIVSHIRPTTRWLSALGESRLKLQLLIAQHKSGAVSSMSLPPALLRGCSSTRAVAVDLTNYERDLNSPALGQLYQFSGSAESAVNTAENVDLCSSASKRIKLDSAFSDDDLVPNALFLGIGSSAPMAPIGGSGVPFVPAPSPTVASSAPPLACLDSLPSPITPSNLLASSGHSHIQTGSVHSPRLSSGGQSVVNHAVPGQSQGPHGLQAVGNSIMSVSHADLPTTGGCHSKPSDSILMFANGRNLVPRKSDLDNIFDPMPSPSVATVSAMNIMPTLSACPTISTSVSNAVRVTPSVPDHLSFVAAKIPPIAPASVGPIFSTGPHLPAAVVGRTLISSNNQNQPDMNRIYPTPPSNETLLTCAQSPENGPIGLGTLVGAPTVASCVSTQRPHAPFASTQLLLPPQPSFSWSQSSPAASLCQMFNVSKPPTPSTSVTKKPDRIVLNIKKAQLQANGSTVLSASLSIGSVVNPSVCAATILPSQYAAVPLPGNKRRRLPRPLVYHHRYLSMRRSTSGGGLIGDGLRDTSWTWWSSIGAAGANGASVETCAATPMATTTPNWWRQPQQQPSPCGSHRQQPASVPPVYMADQGPLTPIKAAPRTGRFAGTGPFSVPPPIHASSQPAARPSLHQQRSPALSVRPGGPSSVPSVPSVGRPSGTPAGSYYGPSPAASASPYNGPLSIGTAQLSSATGIGNIVGSASTPSMADHNPFGEGAGVDLASAAGLTNPPSVPNVPSCARTPIGGPPSMGMTSPPSGGATVSGPVWNAAASRCPSAAQEPLSLPPHANAANCASTAASQPGHSQTHATASSLSVASQSVASVVSATPAGTLALDSPLLFAFLYDSVLLLLRDMSFDGCSICVCRSTITGWEQPFYLFGYTADNGGAGTRSASAPTSGFLPSHVNDATLFGATAQHGDCRCSCGFSAIVNRRLSNRTGLFLEDELDTLRSCCAWPIVARLSSLPQVAAAPLNFLFSSAAPTANASNTSTPPSSSVVPLSMAERQLIDMVRRNALCLYGTSYLVRRLLDMAADAEVEADMDDFSRGRTPFHGGSLTCTANADPRFNFDSVEEFDAIHTCAFMMRQVFKLQMDDFCDWHSTGHNVVEQQMEAIESLELELTSVKEAPKRGYIPALNGANAQVALGPWNMPKTNRRPLLLHDWIGERRRLSCLSSTNNTDCACSSDARVPVDDMRLPIDARLSSLLTSQVYYLLKTLQPMLVTKLSCCRAGCVFESSCINSGLLSWREFCLLATSSASSAAGLGSVMTGGRPALAAVSDACCWEPQPLPLCVVGFDRDSWLTLTPRALRHWERLGIAPFGPPRDVSYLVIAPDGSPNVPLDDVRVFFSELSAMYEVCQLGQHRPGFPRLSQGGMFRCSRNMVAKVVDKPLPDWWHQMVASAEAEAASLISPPHKAAKTASLPVGLVNDLAFFVQYIVQLVLPLMLHGDSTTSSSANVTLQGQTPIMAAAPATPTSPTFLPQASQLPASNASSASLDDNRMQPAGRDTSVFMERRFSQTVGPSAGGTLLAPPSQQTSPATASAISAGGPAASATPIAGQLVTLPPSCRGHVVYVVDPLTEKYDRLMTSRISEARRNGLDTSAATAMRDLVAALISRVYMRCSDDVQDRMRQHKQQMTFLHPLPLSQVMYDGSEQNRTQHLKRLAFGIYMQAMQPHRPPIPQVSLTGLGPSSDWRQRILQGSAGGKSTQQFVFCPPFVLAANNRLGGKHVGNSDMRLSADGRPTGSTGNAGLFSQIPSQILAAPYNLMDQSNVLYCTYCLTDDQSLLIAACSDDRGLLIDTCVIDIRAPANLLRSLSGAGGLSTTQVSIRRYALAKLWQFLVGIMVKTPTVWRLVISRLGRLGHGELKGWAGLLSAKHLSQATSRCLSKVCRICNMMINGPTATATNSATNASASGHAGGSAGTAANISCRRPRYTQVPSIVSACLLGVHWMPALHVFADHLKRSSSSQPAERASAASASATASSSTASLGANCVTAAFVHPQWPDCIRTTPGRNGSISGAGPGRPDQRSTVATTTQLATVVDGSLHDTSCTHILVLPVSATAQSSVQSAGPSREHDLIPNMDLLDDIMESDIFKMFSDDIGSVITQSMVVDSTGRMTPHIVGGNTSALSLQSVLEAEDDSSGGALLQQPLAIGYYVCTAPVGPFVPSWFVGKHRFSSTRTTAAAVTDGITKLRATLHLHQVACWSQKSMEQPNTEASGGGSTGATPHPLDSNLMSDVLRYVLERFNALSWLTVDPATGERQNCWPVHFQVLLQLHAALRAFAAMVPPASSSSVATNSNAAAGSSSANLAHVELSTSSVNSVPLHVASGTQPAPQASVHRRHPSGAPDPVCSFVSLMHLRLEASIRRKSPMASLIPVGVEQL